MKCSKCVDNTLALVYSKSVDNTLALVYSKKHTRLLEKFINKICKNLNFAIFLFLDRK